MTIFGVLFEPGCTSGQDIDVVIELCNEVVITLDVTSLGGALRRRRNGCSWRFVVLLVLVMWYRGDAESESQECRQISSMLDIASWL